MAWDCLPYVASIWPTDCQAVTSCTPIPSYTPIPERVEAHDCSWSGRSVAASSWLRRRNDDAKREVKAITGEMAGIAEAAMHVPAIWRRCPPQPAPAG